MQDVEDWNFTTGWLVATVILVRRAWGRPACRPAHGAGRRAGRPLASLIGEIA